MHSLSYTHPAHHLYTSPCPTSPPLLRSWLDADGVPYMHRCGIFQLRHFMGMVPPRMLFAADHLGGGPGQYGQGGWHIAAGIVGDNEDELLEFWCVQLALSGRV